VGPRMAISGGFSDGVIAPTYHRAKRAGGMCKSTKSVRIVLIFIRGDQKSALGMLMARMTAPVRGECECSMEGIGSDRYH
jgi:hypothetical protein